MRNSNGRLWAAIAILLLVIAGIGLYAWKPEWITGSKAVVPAPPSTVVRAQPNPRLPPPKTVAVQPPAPRVEPAKPCDDTCQKWLVEAHAEVADQLKRHVINDVQAAEANAYFDKRYTGDSVDDKGRPVWNTKFEDGVMLKTSYRTVKGECTCTVHLVVRIWCPESPKPRPKTAFVPPPVEHCVEVSFNGVVGQSVRWGVVGDDGPLPPSRCNAQRQGNGPWYAWFGWCEECQAAIDYLQAYYRGAVELYQRYTYDVTDTRQTIRTSTAIWSKTLYICRQDANGHWSKGVYIHPRGPAAWNHRYRIPISDSMWEPE